jgi:hypothetical protein
MLQDCVEGHVWGLLFMRSVDGDSARSERVDSCCGFQPLARALWACWPFLMILF